MLIAVLLSLTNALKADENYHYSNIFFQEFLMDSLSRVKDGRIGRQKYESQ
jgi:hypothetical protein